MAAAACLAVFPRAEETTTLVAAVVGVALVRIAASFLVPQRTNAGPTLVMAAGALVLAFDLGRAVWGGSSVDGSASVVEIAPPFEGEWLVAQGGRSPLQNHHLAVYNQHFALDLVRLDDGRIFTEETGNASVHSWEQPLVSPAEGTVVVARDGMDDSEGANFVSDPRDAAGNVVVIELDTGGFVVLAHLRRGTLRVSEGDRVRTGDPLARVGNSGNTTMPHLHLQVQTHRDLWDPDNRSVPFAFEPDGRVLARNDRVGPCRAASVHGVVTRTGPVQSPGPHWIFIWPNIEPSLGRRPFPRQGWHGSRYRRRLRRHERRGHRGQGVGDGAFG